MPFLLALLLGAASAFAFEPVGLWPLMPLAIAILCELIARAPNLRRALLVGWAFGVGQFAVGLNWIATAFTFQAAMPAWLGWIAVILIALYLAVYPMLAAGLGWKLGQGKRLPLILALAGGWAITEWLRAGIFTGFAWNPVGVTLADTPLLKTSGLVGTYGLSAIVVLIGGALWLLSRRDYKAPAGLAILILLLWAFPAARIPDGSTVIKPIRIVQPNIGQEDKWRDGFDAVSDARLESLSLPRSPKARLLFWPEMAITRPLEDSRAESSLQLAVAFERKRAGSLIGPGDLLLTGGMGLAASDGRTIDSATNSVFVLAFSGRVLGRYDKAHLVPYGEYLPMRPFLSALGLSRLAPGDLDFAASPGPRSVDLGAWGKVGFQLCYEIIFSGEVVDRADRPDFIFNPSNDAWFGRWGPPQHLAQARLRAAEEGLPVIRSTPTGISAVIDAHGRLIRALPWRQAGVIDAVLPPPAMSLTPFARLGNILPLLFAAALIISAIALARRRR